jgi:hypothetical protein
MASRRRDANRGHFGKQVTYNSWTLLESRIELEIDRNGREITCAYDGADDLPSVINVAAPTKIN